MLKSLKTIWIVGLFIAVGLFGVNSAYAAVPYLGGSYDGYSVATGATMDAVTISSAATQIFTQGDSATAISPITISQEANPDGGINTTDHIRVQIPAGLGMIWQNDTAATIGGTASTKVLATVSYPDNKTLLITVTGNFVNGDYITVSDLSFENFSSPGFDNLGLEIDNLGTSIVLDDKQKRIGPDQYTGGSYDGYDSDSGMNFVIGTEFGGLTISGVTLH